MRLCAVGLLLAVATLGADRFGGVTGAAVPGGANCYTATVPVESISAVGVITLPAPTSDPTNGASHYMHDVYAEDGVTPRQVTISGTSNASWHGTFSVSAVTWTTTLSGKATVTVTGGPSATATGGQFTTQYCTFAVGTVYNRKVLVDPLGNAFWMKGVFSASVGRASPTFYFRDATPGNPTTLTVRQGLSVTVDPDTDVFTTAVPHKFLSGQDLRFASAGTLPTGLSATATYDASDLTNTTFKLVGVNVSSAGSGVHTVYADPSFLVRNGATVTIAGGTGEWAALNGARVVTTTEDKDVITVPVDSTGFTDALPTNVRISNATAWPLLSRYLNDQNDFGENMRKRLLGWGFNVLGQYSATYSIPVRTGATSPATWLYPMPFIRSHNTSLYGLQPRNGVDGSDDTTCSDAATCKGFSMLAAHPAKAVVQGTVSASSYVGTKQMVDPYDPNFVQFLKNLMADIRTVKSDGTTQIRATGYYENASIPGVKDEDGDYTDPPPAPHRGLRYTNWLLGTDMGDVDFQNGVGPGPSHFISDASNTNPIVITVTAPHRMTNGDAAHIRRVQGNTAANGDWVATVLSPTTFSIPAVGNGEFVPDTGSGTRPLVDTDYAAEGADGVIQPHIAWLVAAGAPYQSVNGLASDGVVALYSDTVNYAKAAWSTFLQGRYANIAALNTAWGSAYSTFGTSGTTTPATSTMAVVGATGGAVADVLVEVASTSSLTTGQHVHIIGVAGKTGINNTWKITVTDGTHFSLNRALGSAYSATYTSGGTIYYDNSAWGTGTGVLDEDGTGPHMNCNAGGAAGGTACICPADDLCSNQVEDAYDKVPNGLGHLSTALADDLDTFLKLFFQQFFGAHYTAIKAATPNHLVFGSDMLNGHKGLTRKPVLEAAAGNMDVMIVNQDSARPWIAKTTYEHSGLPMWSWVGGRANGDSAMALVPGSTTVTNTYNQFATQALRYANHESIVNTLWNARGDDGVYPGLGFVKWELFDNNGEKSNWGMLTFNGNAYDGAENVPTLGTDADGYPIGGEYESTGDFVGPISALNLVLDQRLLGAASPASLRIQGRVTFSGRTGP